MNRKVMTAILSAILAGGIAAAASLVLGVPAGVALGLLAGSLALEAVHSRQSGRPTRWRAAVLQGILSGGVAFAVLSRVV